VGFLLGETKKQDVLKDQAMLKRLNDIASFPEEDKQHILYTLDALIKSVKYYRCKKPQAMPAAFYICNI